MSNFIERILGVKPFEDEINDSDEECYFENLRREREKLKEKTFNTEEDLTYDEFIRFHGKKFSFSYNAYNIIMFIKVHRRPAESIYRLSIVWIEIK